MENPESLISNIQDLTMAEKNEEDIKPQNKENKYSIKKRNPKSLWFNSQSKGILLVFQQ